MPRKAAKPKNDSPKRSASRSRAAPKTSRSRKQSESPKRAASRPRQVSSSPKRAQSRSRQRSESPSPKARGRPKSRGRTPTRKVESTTRVSRSRSASRSRRGAESPATPSVKHESAVNVLATGTRHRGANELRAVRTDAAATAKAHRGKKLSTSLWSSLRLDFCGPLGSAAMMLVLPPFVFALNSICTFSAPGRKSKATCSLDELCTNNTQLVDNLKQAAQDYKALVFLLGWLGLQAIFYLLPIGTVVDGYDVRERLRYRVNLPYALLLTVAAVAFTVTYLHVDVFAFVVRHLFGIAWWSMVLSFMGATVLFVAGKNNRTNAVGNSGWTLHEFFLGRTRNPRISSSKWLALFDFKMFFELRPGLLLWALVDISYLLVHFREVRALDIATVWYGTPEGFSWNLALLVTFHVIYVVDAALGEEKILTTFDILTEGFGWMLLFGDIAFVPFVYSSGARYLLASHGTLGATAQSPLYLVLVTLMQLLGYFVFRATNNVKHAFRSTPNADSLAHLRTMAVAGGRKILVSGWWGLSRHPNYVGDILMSWSWALLTGWPPNLGAFALAYFYPIFLTGLLLSRAVRDDAVRREKYGEAAWKRYSELVKYRVFPYIF